MASFELSRIHGKSNLRTFKDGWLVLATILREWVPKHHRRPHTPPTRLQAGRRQGGRRSGDAVQAAVVADGSMRQVSVGPPADPSR